MEPRLPPGQNLVSRPPSIPAWLNPRLDTLLLTMPIAWKGTVVQYAGRLHRPHPGKREARIYDYVDAEVPVLRRMFAKRAKSYRAMSYTIAA